RNAVPVLAIAAHIPTSEIGSSYFQETQPEILFRDCSHYCKLVSDPDQMPRVLEEAIRAAVGQRGVAVIVISGDTALKDAIDAPVPKVAGLLPARPLVRPGGSGLDKLAALVEATSRGN